MAFKMKGFSGFHKNGNPKGVAKAAKKAADVQQEKGSTKVGGYTTSGIPDSYTTASGKKISSAGVDEGNLSKTQVDKDGRKFVVVQEDAAGTKAGTKLYLPK